MLKDFNWVQCFQLQKAGVDSVHMLSLLRFTFKLWVISSEDSFWVLRRCLDSGYLMALRRPGHATHTCTSVIKLAAKRQSQAALSTSSCDLGSWWSQFQPQDEFRASVGREHGQNSVCFLNPTHQLRHWRWNMASARSLRKGWEAREQRQHQPVWVGGPAATQTGKGQSALSMPWLWDTEEVVGDLSQVPEQPQHALVHTVSSARHVSMEQTWASQPDLLGSELSLQGGGQGWGRGQGQSSFPEDNPSPPRAAGSLVVPGEGITCPSPNEQPWGCRQAPAVLGSQTLLLHHTFSSVAD